MSEACGCVWVPEDNEGPAVCTERMVHARKVHRCCECGRDIGVGEKHEYVSGLWYGRWDTFRTCADCLSVRDAFFCNGYLYGALWEYMGEHVREMRGDIRGDCLVPLTPVSRARVCDLIEDAWERYYDDDE